MSGAQVLPKPPPAPRRPSVPAGSAQSRLASSTVASPSVSVGRIPVEYPDGAMIEVPFVMREAETVLNALSRIFGDLIGVPEVVAANCVHQWSLCIEPHEKQDASDDEDEDEDDDPVHEIALGPSLIVKLSQPLPDAAILAHEVADWQAMYPELECRLSMRKVCLGSSIAKQVVSTLQVNPLAPSDDATVFQIVGRMSDETSQSQSGATNSKPSQQSTGESTQSLLTLPPPPRARYLSHPPGPRQAGLSELAREAGLSASGAAGGRASSGAGTASDGTASSRTSVPISSVQLSVLCEEVASHLLGEASLPDSVTRGLSDSIQCAEEGEVQFAQMLDEAQNGLVAIDASSGHKRAMLVDSLLALARGDPENLEGILGGEFDFLDEVLPQCVDPEGKARAGVLADATRRAEELLKRGESDEQRHAIHRGVAGELQCNPCAGSVAFPVILDVKRIWSSKEGEALPPGLRYLVGLPDDDGKHAVAVVASEAGVLILQPGMTDRSPHYYVICACEWRSFDCEAKPLERRTSVSTSSSSHAHAATGKSAGTGEAHSSFATLRVPGASMEAEITAVGFDAGRLRTCLEVVRAKATAANS